MKAVFLGQEAVIRRVYGEDTLAFLERETGLSLSVVVTKANLEAHKSELKDTVYAFSTWGMEHYTAEEIKTYFPSLRCLFYAAGTVKDFAAEFLEAGVRVFSAWAANAIPVAEYAVSQIILANKGFFNTCRLYTAEKNHPASAKAFEAYPGNYGATVGLIGVGMIGSMVAERLKNFRLKVLAFDPFCSAEKAEALGVSLVSLEELFTRADVISNHLANKPETRGILHAGLFSRMKPTVTFINTGRGAQLVEKDLAEAMKERPLASAVLDVTDPEPCEENSVFHSCPNIYLTPHIAGSAGDEVHRMAEYMAETYQTVRESKPSPWEVFPQMLATMA